MYTNTIALALAPLLLVAHAKVDFDLDDAPNQCKTICKPLGQLSDMCDVDLRSDIDRDENLLQAQCICTNKSFDVAKISALCADCMHQSASKNTRNKKRDNDNDDDDDDDDDDRHADKDDLRDIDNVMMTCGFASSSYSPAATSEANGINVSASKPTDISQLTTTLDGTNQMPSTTSNVGAATTSTDMGNTGSTGGATGSQTTDQGATQTDDANASGSGSPSPTSNAAPGGILVGGSILGVFYVAGAAAVGGIMMVL